MWTSQFSIFCIWNKVILTFTFEYPFSILLLFFLILCFQLYYAWPSVFIFTFHKLNNIGFQNRWKSEILSFQISSFGNLDIDLYIWTYLYILTYDRPKGGASFVNHLCYLCLVLVCFHARLFVNILWSPAWKWLTSWLSFVMSNRDVVTFPLVSWVRCGAWLYRLLIFALFLTFLLLNEALFVMLKPVTILLFFITSFFPKYIKIPVCHILNFYMWRHWLFYYSCFC